MAASSQSSQIAQGEVSLEKLKTFCDLSEQNAQVVRKVSDKDVVLVFGTTGAGKSTTINTLCGAEMRIEKEEQDGHTYKVVKAYPANGFTPVKIGTKDVSETLIANIAQDPRYKIVYVDCPGHKDNRGWEVALANSANILNIVRACRSIKIMVVIPGSSADTTRGESIKEILNVLNNLLQDAGGLPYFVNNIVLVVTKVKTMEEVWKVKRIATEVETLLRVIGISFEDEHASKYKFADDEGDFHPGTPEQLVKVLSDDVKPVQLKSAPLRAPITNEDRHVLIQLQGVVRERVEEVGMANIEEALKLFRAIEALRALQCSEVENMLTNMKQSFLYEFEKATKAVSEALNERKIDDAIKIKESLEKTLEQIMYINPDVYDYIAKKQLVVRCGFLIDQVVESERKLEQEKLAAMKAEEAAIAAQQAKEAAELMAEAERQGNLEAQEAAKQEYEHRLELQSKLEQERQEAVSRSQEAAAAENQNRIMVEKLLDEFKAQREADRERQEEERKEREKMQKMHQQALEMQAQQFQQALEKVNTKSSGICSIM
eukprot:TRINITY_DN8255_c1_g1_i1.p1 TRINITY_DN8255_c1_g1~~TRINITY_DN8255_c1_g1_i1.p1  ORF type:complete len:545 (-),score=96.58 TRINITY_DN8255_c1_g1_i1:405-2039(-)